MSRQRMIKPSFFSSESLAECSYPARIAFIGLWTCADDFGKEKFSPRVLRSQIFPLDDVSIEEFIGYMAELEEVGCIRLYVVGDSVYYHVPNFKTYQTVNNPSKTNIPDFCSSAVVALRECCSRTNAKELIKELINQRRARCNADAQRGPFSDLRPDEYMSSLLEGKNER